jgi:hypothetical protein
LDDERLFFSLEASVHSMPTFPKHVPRMDVKKGYYQQTHDPFKIGIEQS